MAQVLCSSYGGTWGPCGVGSMDFTNGSITAARIEDIYDSQVNGPVALHPLSITGDVGDDDQLWTADYQMATAKALWGNYQQEFGYLDGLSSNTYVRLFNQTGYGDDVQGSANLTSLSGHTLRWARGGQGRVFSSRISDNTDGKDHMITYRVEGLPDAQQGIVTWVLMWEDKYSWEPTADFDFNDIVVEIKAKPLPEPAIALPVLGMLLLGSRRRTVH